jgi:hypothetical protein
VSKTLLPRSSTRTILGTPFFIGFELASVSTFKEKASFSFSNLSCRSLKYLVPWLLKML